jgi:hypothetical protein
MIQNDICKKCGGICCQGQLSGYPKCRWLADSGCMLCQNHRDSGCNFFPFVIVEDQRLPKSRRVFLDTCCPYFLEFAKMRDQILDSDTYSLLILEGTYRK